MSAVATPLVEPPATWSLPYRGHGRHGLPHRGGVGDLHDLRGGVPLLRGEEPQRADAARRARDADLLHDLPAVEQPDHPPRGQGARTRQGARIPRLVAAHDRARRPVHVRHGPGMAPADLRTRPDDLHEPVRHDLLLAGRPARVSRHRGSGRCCRSCCCSVWPAASAAIRPTASACCRCTGISWTPCGSSCSPWST